MKPITPKEARENRGSSFPDFVMAAFNEVITENLDAKGSAEFIQNIVIDRILAKQPQGNMTPLTRKDVFDKNWLDVEIVYEQAGWTVEYDKPGFNESYLAKFIFRPKRQTPRAI